MRIIAIDPGYERLGIAVLEKLPKQKEVLLYSTCVQTPKTLPHAERLLKISEAARKVIEEFGPEMCAIETLFLAVNQKTAMPVAEARGAVLVEAARAGLTVYEYTPLQIKIAVTGYGRSDKRQVTEMVKKLISIPDKTSLLPTCPPKRLRRRREKKSLPPQTASAQKYFSAEKSFGPASRRRAPALRKLHAFTSSPFSKGRIMLDDEYDAIAVGLTHLASTKWSMKHKT